MKDFEALPCPFCAANPEWTHFGSGKIFHNSGVKEVYKWYSGLSCVICRQSSAFGKAKVSFYGGNALAQQAAMKESLRKWNRRS